MTNTTTNEQLAPPRPPLITDEQWNLCLSAYKGEGGTDLPRQLAIALIDAMTSLKQARDAHEQITASYRRVRSQLVTVGDMLLEEAEERDWCDEYNTFVDNVNSRAGADVLSRMEYDYSVCIGGTISVTARSADAAREMVQDDIDHFASDYSMDIEITDIEQV